MSEHIVHTGVLEDCFAIAPYLKLIPDDFAHVMRKHGRFAQLGSITVAGDQFTFRLLEQFKPLWAERDDVLEAKLAFVLGWVSHRACDRQMKPIWNISEMKGRGSDADPSLSPTTCSVYHEGTLYNLYYKDNPDFKLAIFEDELKKSPCAELFDLDLAAAYMESAFGVNMMDIQTFAPPPEGQRFMEDVCIRAQKFYVDVSRYTKAAGSPDPELLRDFVTDINWYSEDDAIIKVAKKLRNGGRSTTDECEDALNTLASSHYGQALQLSLRYFIAAADYMNNASMSMDELKDRLDIGKKGRTGLGV
jgi:hypothetical protein